MSLNSSKSYTYTAGWTSDYASLGQFFFSLLIRWYPKNNTFFSDRKTRRSGTFQTNSSHAHTNTLSLVYQFLTRVHIIIVGIMIMIVCVLTAVASVQFLTYSHLTRRYNTNDGWHSFSLLLFLCILMCSLSLPLHGRIRPDDASLYIHLIRVDVHLYINVIRINQWAYRLWSKIDQLLLMMQD